MTIAKNTCAAGAMGAAPHQEFGVFDLYLRQMNRGVSPSPAPFTAFSIRVCLLAFLCAGLPTRAQYRYDAGAKVVVQRIMEELGHTSS